ncbi:MAG: hypothetical protein ACLP8X_19385 [Streptosporangiaceae bacterium]
MTKGRPIPVRPVKLHVPQASAVIASTRASSAEPGTARHSPALAASTARAWSLSSV